MSFKLTYSTMFNPPVEMHERFEAALARVTAGLGATHAFHIDGTDAPGTNPALQAGNPVVALDEQS